jgi:hypothetical protein
MLLRASFKAPRYFLFSIVGFSQTYPLSWTLLTKSPLHLGFIQAEFGCVSVPSSFLTIADCLLTSRDFAQDHCTIHRGSDREYLSTFSHKSSWLTLPFQGLTHIPSTWSVVISPSQLWHGRLIFRRTGGGLSTWSLYEFKFALKRHSRISWLSSASCGHASHHLSASSLSSYH